MNGWEEPELLRWNDRVASEKAWTRQELAELVEFAQRLLPRLAAARGEPGLDVERLEAALVHFVTRRHKYTAKCDGCWSASELVRAALVTPTTPEPDQ